MPTDKRISELPAASTIDGSDLSILVSSGTNYQFAFSTLLGFIGSNLNLGANISFGGTLPQNTSGKNGDLFINTSAGSFAQKISGAWTVVYTLPAAGGSTDGTVLYGLGVPASSTGNNNDTYINTGTGVFYKKSSGAWSQVFSMQTGPAGPAGANGTNGTNGTNGKTILNGTTDPSNLSTGADGDFYINTNTMSFFGPKAGGVWPAGISIVGATGADGPAGLQGCAGTTGAIGPVGATGPGVAAGGTTGQILKKNSNTDYDTSWENLPAGDLSSLEGEIGSLFNLRTYAKDTIVNAINEVLMSAAKLPWMSGLVEFFDFTDMDSMVISGSNITQITGKKGNVSAQTDPTKQPTINYSGGVGNLPYASFRNSFLTGSDFFTGTDFTIVILWRLVDGTKQTQCPFFIGSSSPWTGFGLLGNCSDPHNNSGLYYLGTGFERPAYDSGTPINQWMIHAGSHTSGSNKWYNAAGVVNTTIATTEHPIDPAGTAHYIGQIANLAAGTNLYGDIQGILVYEGQKTDDEVAKLYSYLYQRNAYTQPINLVTDGDSITYGYGSTFSYPLQTFYQLLAENYWSALSNISVIGILTTDIITNITARQATYKADCHNVYCLMIGHNDLQQAGANPASIFANIQSILSTMKSAGFKTVVSTILVSANEVSDSTKMANLNTLNADIMGLTSAYADVVFDARSLANLQNPSDSTYWYDGEHLNTAGDTEVKNSLTPLLETLFASL